MIDKKIKLLGDSFRGIWQSKELTSKARLGMRLGRELPKNYVVTQWYVTFKYNGDFLETESQNTIEEALDYAINFLKLSL